MLNNSFTWYCPNVQRQELMFVQQCFLSKDTSNKNPASHFGRFSGKIACDFLSM